MTTKILDNDTNVDEEFELLEKIGRGAYGAVYKAKHLASDKIVALKKQKIDGDLVEVMQEVSIMGKCESDYLVSFLGNKLEITASRNSKLIKEEEMWIAMEFCLAGSVDNIMLILEMTFTEEEIAILMEASLLGLKYLHNKNMIHRDIKPGNILVTENLEVKLADFGVSGLLTKFEQTRQTMTGTPYYIAPEILDDEAEGYTQTVDIWSLGITAIELADGKPPHGNMEPMRVLSVIAKNPPPTLEKPSDWSDEFNDFLTQSLHKDPEERWTAVQLLKHPFITKMRSKETLAVIVEKIKSTIAAKGSLENALRDVDSSDDSTRNTSSDIPQEGSEEGQNKSSEEPEDKTTKSNEEKDKDHDKTRETFHERRSAPILLKTDGEDSWDAKKIQSNQNSNNDEKKNKKEEKKKEKKEKKSKKEKKGWFFRGGTDRRHRRSKSSETTDDEEIMRYLYNN